MSDVKFKADVDQYASMLFGMVLVYLRLEQVRLLQHALN